MEIENAVSAVKENLKSRYRHPDDTVRAQADRWLQDFQGTDYAWKVAKILLDDSSELETLIFGSQTLRIQVQRNFEEITLGGVHSTRDLLLEYFRNFHSGPPKVRTEISISLAALVVHVPAADWGDGDVISWFKAEMNMHPEYAPGFLQLLTVLLEEALHSNIAAHPDRLRTFKKELTSQIEAVLTILQEYLNREEVKEQVLEAFASWLRLRHEWIPGALLDSCHPLVNEALLSLKSYPLSEASVNVVSELIHHAASPSSGGISVQTDLSQVIVKQVLSMKTHLTNSKKGKEDLKAIGRLLADLGDSYVELIATGPVEHMAIVDALVEVMSHPEYDIASMTFNFWHSLQVADRVQYPENYQSHSYEDLKEFKQTRYAFADVLTDAASVLGGDKILKILFEDLLACGVEKSAIGSPELRFAEAKLFCIRAISNYVSVNEAEVMPKLMAWVQSLPDVAQLLETVCLLVGAYSKWLKANWTCLPLIIKILERGMCKSEDCVAAAALAFRHICDDCRNKLSEEGSFEDLQRIYFAAIKRRAGYIVSAADSLLLLEGLSMVVGKLHPSAALKKLCDSPASPLKEAARKRLVTRQLTVHIDRFARIFRYLDHPDAVSTAIHYYWPIFSKFFDVGYRDIEIMESLCRACKYAVRTFQNEVIYILEKMLGKIQDLYPKHPQPSFLYLSSEIIKIFGCYPLHANSMRRLIEIIFKHTTGLLKSIEDFTANPEIAKSCFLLASNCILHCPLVLIDHAVFPLLVDCSMAGIRVHHTEAFHTIVSFLSQVIELENHVVDIESLNIKYGIITPRGVVITRLLMALLTGASPSSHLEMVTRTLLALRRAYRTQAVNWVQRCLSLIPGTAANQQERTRFIDAFANEPDVTSLLRHVEELSAICRRSKKVQHSVQAALCLGS